LVYRPKEENFVVVEGVLEGLGIVCRPHIVKLLIQWFLHGGCAVCRSACVVQCRSVKLSKLVGVLETTCGRLAEVTFCSHGKQQHCDWAICFLFCGDCCPIVNRQLKFDMAGEDKPVYRFLWNSFVCIEKFLLGYSFEVLFSRHSDVSICLVRPSRNFLFYFHYSLHLTVNDFLSVVWQS
jgi:hypothetical protein